MSTANPQADLPGAEAEAGEPKPNTNLVVVQGAIEHFERVNAGMAALTARYDKVVYAVDTKEGMEQAKAGRAELRGIRVEAERVRTSGKAPLLKIGKDLDGFAAKIKSGIEALEDPIDAQIKKEEERKEAEKKAAAEAEQRRIASLQAFIEEIRETVTMAFGQPAGEILKMAERVEQMVPSEATFAEFLDSAKVAIHETAKNLRRMHTEAKAAEDARAEAEANKAELEELRAAQAKQREEAATREAAEAEEKRKRDEQEEAQRRARQRQEYDARAARVREEEAALEQRRAELRREEEALAERQRAAREEEERRAAAVRAQAEAEERARQEEVARINAEAQAKRDAEERQQQEDERQRIAAIEAAAAKKRADRAARIATRPGDNEILNARRVAFSVPKDRLFIIPEWLRDMDLESIEAELKAETEEMTA